ncbi:MAG: hypothetical protein M1821_000518 [Bathelium mastoideum]|nr:MAG: hypothetical protein M1821_000518 [Bathelium mastoideum]
MPSENSSDKDLSSIAVPGHATFNTQGSLNWADVASKPIEATVAILSRVSAAGVDPYTLLVGQHLGKAFELTSLGRKNITDAVMQLKSFHALGKTLWFGFGVNDLIRIMARTEEGKVCLSLCATLAACYDAMIAAETLLEMTKLTRAPEHMMPSIMEWKSLVESCAGAFARSPFPKMAERYMQMHPEGRIMNCEAYSKDFIGRRSCAQPRELAKVLIAISQISRRELISVTVAGGSDTGWLIAFCEWHFQLVFRIIDGSSGDILYPRQDHDANNGDVQINFIFEMAFPAKNNIEQHSTKLRLDEKIYRLGDATELIFTEDNHFSSARACVAGQIEWSTVLSEHFGIEFKMIQGSKRAFGRAIGCFARILKAIVTGEKGTSIEERRRCPYYNDAAYGRGLIVGLVSRYPELAQLKVYMEEACCQTRNEALLDYESNYNALKEICDCGSCHNSDVPGAPGSEERYCLIILMELLIWTVRILSEVIVPRDLSPSKLGLVALYDRLVTYSNIPSTGVSRYSMAMMFSSIGDPDFDGAWSVLQSAATLFCGRVDPQSLSLNEHCALVCSGICVYLESLCHFEPLNAIGRICIVPGRIQLHGRNYNQLIDDKVLGAQDTYESLSEKWIGLPCPDYEVSLRVHEKPSMLQIVFEIRNKENVMIIQHVSSTYVRQQMLTASSMQRVL